MEDAANKEQSTVSGEDGEFRAENNTSEEVEKWLFSMENDDEDGAIDLSEFLEASVEKTHPMKVKIIDDPCWYPLIFQTAASYITINGNEESCGSSFSDSDASYMAGIASGCGLVVADGGGACDGDAVEAETEEEEEKKKNGNCLVNASTGGYCDDDMLAQFLGDDVAQAPRE